MRRAVLSSLLGLALLAVALPAPAAPMLLSGDITHSQVTNLTTQINWNTNLNDALMQARREGKMVFYVHMLGDIKGAT